MMAHIYIDIVYRTGRLVCALLVQIINTYILRALVEIVTIRMEKRNRIDDIWNKV